MASGRGRQEPRHSGCRAPKPLASGIILWPRVRTRGWSQTHQPSRPTRALSVLLELVGPTFILLVRKLGAILILPTLFNCTPFNTTQQKLYLPKVKAYEAGI